MSNIILTDKVEGTVTDQFGTTTSVPVVKLTDEQAALMREYKKKILSPLGLREALFCNSCGHATMEDGCKAFVTDSQIGVICRCTQRLYLGQSF
jgi:hypothetical protein